MKELERRSESSDLLLDTGVRSVSTIVGGAALLLLRGFTAYGGLSIPGLVIGGVIALFGVSSAGASKHRADRVGGLLTAAAGALTVTASLPLLGAAAGTVMWIGGIGLLGYGVVNLARFLRGIRRRK